MVIMNCQFQHIQSLYTPIQIIQTETSHPMSRCHALEHTFNIIQPCKAVAWLNALPALMELLRSSGASATEIAQVSPHEDPRILVADEQTICVVMGPVWVERGRKLHTHTDTHACVYINNYIYIYIIRIKVCACGIHISNNDHILRIECLHFTKFYRMSYQVAVACSHCGLGLNWYGLWELDMFLPAAGKGWSAV